MYIRRIVLLLVAYLESICSIPTSSGVSTTGEIREYCLTEYFNASCPGANDVILMTSAQYGRMRLGRCIRGDYNLGCSNDVIGLFDAQCSGRKSCDVSVRTLVDIRPCQRDFASFLEASYTCIKVLDLQMSSCPSPIGAAVAMGTPTGYLSNTLYEAYSSLGRPGCPWIIRAEPGQRIELTIYTLYGLRPVATPNAGEVDSAHTCTKIIIVEGELNSMSSSNDGGDVEELFPFSSSSSSATGSAVEFGLCIKRTRERRLYTSNGHVLTVYTVTSLPLLQSTSGHSSRVTSGSAADTRFLLMYRILGCPNLVLPDRAWVKTIGSQGDDVMVRCNDTLETWYLSCQGNQWIGHYDNCTEVESIGGQLGSTVKKQSSISSPTGRGSQQQSLSHGIAMALGLGMVLGIFIALIALCTICCVQHWCGRRPVNDKPISELMVTIGHPQLLRAASGATVEHENIKPLPTMIDYDGCTELVLPQSSAAAPASQHYPSPVAGGTYAHFNRSASPGRSRHHQQFVRDLVLGSPAQQRVQRHQRAAGSETSRDSIAISAPSGCEEDDDEVCSERRAAVLAARQAARSLDALEGDSSGALIYVGDVTGGNRCRTSSNTRHHSQFHPPLTNDEKQARRWHEQQQQQPVVHHQCYHGHTEACSTQSARNNASSQRFNLTGSADGQVADVSSYPPGLRTPH